MLDSLRLQTARFFRNWWLRVGSASKTDFALVLLAYAAKLYMTSFAVWMAGVGFETWGAPHFRWYVAFLIAVAYSTAQPYFPKSTTSKWAAEDLRRTKALSVAVAMISSSLWNGRMSDRDKHDLFGRLLSAIKSEVEDITGDRDGIYLNVSLLLDDKDDLVEVVCRANNDRAPASYKKSTLLVSKAFSSGEELYVEDCDLADKPYKAIYAMPLVSAPQNSRMFVQGLVSIDSSRGHHFDGLEDAISTRVLPYLNLIKLVLIADEKLRVRRQNGRKRDP